MKIYHEAPVSIFDNIQKVTDGDYFLVHLFETNPAYWQKAVESVSKGREVILDNSIFELGTAFESNAYYEWVKKLNPTWFIIPDVLEECDSTINKLDDWFSKYETPAGMKTIGVVQGKTYDEFVKCYNHIQSKVDKVAISFDYSYYKNIIGDDITDNKHMKYMLGRIELIARLADDKIINFNKPHHLLGCSLPQEFVKYRGMKWIDSVDTSNPVVHGINGIQYSEGGLTSKINTKLIEYMDQTLTEDQIKNVMTNVDMFRRFAKQ